MRTKNKFRSNVQKITGVLKEKAGKITGNSELELKGKLDQVKGDTREKVKDIKAAGKEAFKDVKQSAAKKSNDLIDKLKKDK